MAKYYSLSTKCEILPSELEEWDAITTQINTFFFGEGARTLVQISCPECLTYMETYMKEEEFEGKDSISCYVCGEVLQKSFDEDDER
jgi:hypothetical protein